MRDGTGIYTLPPGTDGGPPGDTISSSEYNSVIHDLANDANVARPIVAGGTGATTPSAALAALGGVSAASPIMTGDLFITKAQPAIILRGDPGTNSDYMVAQKNLKTRWLHYLADNGPESGANAGSDWTIQCYADDGSTIIATALKGTRATGLLTIAGNPTAALGIAPKQYVDARGGPYHCQAFLNANQSFASATKTKIVFNANQGDPLGWLNTGLGRVTPTIPGRYLVTANFSTNVTSPTSAFWLAMIYRNGVETFTWLFSNTALAGTQSMTVSGIVTCNGSTDYIEGWVRATGTSPFCDGVAGGSLTWMSIAFIGPQS